MMRRAVWFCGGVVTGAVGTGYAKRKVAAAAERMRPANVATAASAAIRRRGQRAVGAVQAGMTSALRRENEQRAEREGRLVRLRDQLSEGDQVLVDGEVVEPGRVILMRRRESSSRR
jgi:hypothetical protein